MQRRKLTFKGSSETFYIILIVIQRFHECNLRLTCTLKCSNSLTRGLCVKLKGICPKVLLVSKSIIKMTSIELFVSWYYEQSFEKQYAEGIQKMSGVYMMFLVFFYKLKAALNFLRWEGSSLLYPFGWDSTPDPVFLSLLRVTICYLKTGKLGQKTKKNQFQLKIPIYINDILSNFEIAIKNWTINYSMKYLNS